MRRLLILICSLILLVGCDEDFGDKFYDYVNTQAYPLSQKYGESLLQDKWNNAFNDTIVFTHSKHAMLLANLKKMNSESLLATDSDEQAVIKYKANLTSLHRLTSYQLTLDQIRNDLNTQQGLCFNKSAFYYLGMDMDVVKSMMQLKVDDWQNTYYFSTDLVETGMFWISEFLGMSNHNEQQEKVEEAIKLLNQNIITGDDLFKVSQPLCEEFLAKKQESFDLLEGENEKIMSYLTKLRTLFYENQKIIEKRVSQITSRIIRKKYNLEALYDRIEQFKFSNRRSQEILESYYTLSAQRDQLQTQTGLERYKNLVTYKKHLEQYQTMLRDTNIKRFTMLSHLVTEQKEIAKQWMSEVNQKEEL